MPTSETTQVPVDARTWQDWAGVSFASICIIHCLGLPFIAFMAPTLAVFEENEWLHRGLLVLAAMVAIPRFMTRESFQRNLIVSILGSVGIIGLALATYTTSAEWQEQLGTGISCSLLIAAHILNYRQCK